MGVGGAVASWLVRSTPDRVGRIRVLARDIVLCSWARTLYSHSASLHPGVYMGIGEVNAGGNPAMDWHPIPGGVEILLVASCYRDKRRPDGPSRLIADFTLEWVLRTPDHRPNA